MSVKQIDWDLLKELECPVCVEYMASPISMCENGHNICGTCKERLLGCPTCRGPFIYGRNINLEKIAATAIYPCKNKEAGCKETFVLKDMDNHLAECLLQKQQCPFRKLSDVDCPWTGTLSDITLHILGEHDSETAEMPGHFKVELRDFAVGNSYRRVVHTLEEIFYLAWEKMGDLFSFGVFHIGPKGETMKFKYGFKMCNSAEYVAVIRKTHSYLEGGLKDILPGKCVTLHYGKIKECLGENGNLSCEIEIGERELEGFVVEDMQENLQVCIAFCSSEQQELLQQHEHLQNLQPIRLYYRRRRG
jgi:hypothetical protein